MKNKIFYSLIIVIAIASLWLVVSERIDNTSDGKSLDNKQLPRLVSGNKTIFVEIVKTEVTRAQGLSGRKSLLEESGMLFVFDQPDFYYFWMKGMNFPIDIVWLDKNYQIIDITKNLPPESYPAQVTNKTPAQFVLEINGGLADKYGLKIGDKFTYQP